MLKRQVYNSFFLLLCTIYFLLLTAVPGFCGRVALTTIFVEQDIPIATCQELQDMQNGLTKKYYLASDIECLMTNPNSTGNFNPILDWDPSGTWADRKGFKPVSTFTGSFDGKGHQIKDLYIDRSSENYVGLFGRISNFADIENVGLINVNIKGQNNVGSLCGEGNSFKITNSYSVGSIIGDGQIAGLVGWAIGGEIHKSYFVGSVKSIAEMSGNIAGLIALTDNTRITRSYSGGSVEGSLGGGGHIGGLVGQFHNSSRIENSYSTSDVSGILHVGGLVGRSNAGGTITNSYSTGSVVKAAPYAAHLGGLFATNGGSSAIVTNSYWDTETSGQGGSAGGTGKTTEDMKKEATYQTDGDITDWDFVGDSQPNNIWDINESVTYPYFN